jgi:NitT/TauT family transport system permease protein
MIKSNVFWNIVFILVVAFYVFLIGIIIRNRQGANLLAVDERKSNQILSLIFWFSPLFFISLWGIVSSFNLSILENVPTPVEVIQSFYKLSISGELLLESAISFKRVIIGFFLATIIGVPIGLLAGTYILANKIILPVNSFFRYIPPTAFISLLIVYFGVDEMFKYSIIFLGMIFFIVHMVIDVVDDLDMKYIELGLTSGFSNWQIFTKLIVPSSMPRVFDVLRINIGAAWTFLVAAEIIGAENGLGHLIAISQRFLRMGDLYAGILTFGIIGLVTDRLLNYISKKSFKWYFIELNR